jgi:preprotein translocase subunit SecD
MTFRSACCLFILHLIFSGCISEPNWYQYRDGTQLVLEIQSTNDENLDAENLQQIQKIISGRLYSFGIKQFLTGIDEKNRIIVQFPQSIKDTSALEDLICKPYQLEFRLVDEDRSIEDPSTSDLPQDAEILIEKYGERSYVVQKEVLITGKYIKTAEATFDLYQNPSVEINFTREGAFLFEEITFNHIGKPLAIILDGQLYSAPHIAEKISGGRAVISGNFTLEEAKTLAICLDHTPYPTGIHLLAVSKITEDAWLGKK